MTRYQARLGQVALRVDADSGAGRRAVARAAERSRREALALEASSMRAVPVGGMQGAQQLRGTGHEALNERARLDP